MLRFVGGCTKDGSTFTPCLSTGPSMSDFATARQKMVDGQVRASDVTDHRILDAMLSLPREDFVPEDKRALAYLDLDLDVGVGGSRRYLIKPMLTAKLLQAAAIQPTDTVLIVGCATGYAAALAARLAAKVIAIESDSALAAEGKDILSKLGLQETVTIQAAETAAGFPAGAPFNVIMLNGATEIAPDKLCQQLADNGRMVGVFASAKPSRAMIVTRSHGDFGHRVLFDAAAPVLPGLERRPEFVF
jgi:protein-L-isoaspartate(D-aspartate) O-methyltransferase